MSVCSSLLIWLHTTLKDFGNGFGMQAASKKLDAHKTIPFFRQAIANHLNSIGSSHYLLFSLKFNKLSIKHCLASTCVLLKMGSDDDKKSMLVCLFFFHLAAAGKFYIFKGDSPLHLCNNALCNPYRCKN